MMPGLGGGGLDIMPALDNLIIFIAQQYFQCYNICIYSETKRDSMKLSTTAIALASLLAAGSAPAAVINLVQNGSFEVNGVANGVAANLWSMNGWTVGANGVEVRNNIAGVASDGSNYVELDTFANSWISQAINTSAAAQYTVSFDYSPREFTSAATNGIEVLWNGHALATYSGNNGSGANQWQRYSLSVMGAGSSSNLEFRAVGASDGLGGSLDHVSVTSAVPEPGTMASILLGLGVLGFSLRRRA
jgi:hypothetical protein